MIQITLCAQRTTDNIVSSSGSIFFAEGGVVGACIWEGETGLQTTFVCCCPYKRKGKRTLIQFVSSNLIKISSRRLSTQPNLQTNVWKIRKKINVS